MYLFNDLSEIAERALLSKEKTEVKQRYKLGTLMNPFYFFTDIGQYTGLLAVSLPDFYEKLKLVDTRSLQFHLHRRDFQKWIKSSLNLTELIQDLDLLREKQLTDKWLREQLRIIVACHLEFECIDKIDPDEEQIMPVNDIDIEDDIYNDERRDEMLNDDEITLTEYAFMAGRKMNPSRKKQNWREHIDTLSVELVKEEYRED